MTTLKDISHIDLTKTGWALYNIDTNNEDLLSLANKLGTIKPDDNGNLIQILKPKGVGQGLKGSFSYNLGFSEFPYHTDTAFWTKPAHLILMASEKPSCCDTILIDTNQLINNLAAKEINIFSNAVFTLKTSGGIKFVSLLVRNKTSFQIRYDPNIMTPSNSNAKKTFDIINEFMIHTKPVEIKWTGVNVLVVDNWRVLHKRSECKTEPDRILKRIYIYK